MERVVRSSAARVREETRIRFVTRLASSHVARAGHLAHVVAHPQRALGLLPLQQETQSMENVAAKRNTEGKFIFRFLILRCHYASRFN